MPLYHFTTTRVEEVEASSDKEAYAKVVAGDYKVSRVNSIELGLITRTAAEAQAALEAC